MISKTDSSIDIVKKWPICTS